MGTSKKLIRNHLTIDHPENLHKITNLQWTTLDLHHCILCEDKLYLSKGFLTTHIQNTHEKNNDIDDNISRILQYMPTPISSTNKWKECLPWMHNLHLTPPPFRQNIWLKLNKSTKNRIKAVYHNILQIVVASPLTTSHRPIIPFMHRSDVLWKIAFMFESLILFPFPKNNEDTTATVINK